MKTTRHVRTALWVVVLAATTHAAPDSDSDRRARIQELVEMIATGDAASRAAAADELVQLGPPAVPDVGRFAHVIRDAAARDVLARAFTRLGLDDSIALLVGWSSNWSVKGRPQMKELVASLRALRDPKLATQAELVPAVASNAARVPPDAEFAVGETLPEAIAWGEFAVRKAKGGIQVDVEGSGARWETVEAGRSRALRVGPRKRPILVYWRFDRWYAASASLLAGKVRAEDVELWDADLDGTFTGPRDFVRLGDGAFQRIPEDGLVLGPQGLATMSVRTTDAGATLTLVPEPSPPDVGEWTLRAHAVVNEWRRGVALPPVLLNLTRSAACAKHVDYWRQNGYSGHDEAQDRPGYTAEGAQAGRKSSVWDTAEASKLARVITATVLHRATCLGAAADGLGVANGAGTCIWGGDLDVSARGFPVLVPGPGQESVPAVCESEIPPPDRDVTYYSQPHGYPVAVVWKGVWNDVKSSRLELFAVTAAGGVDPVPGELFTPENPYSDKGRPIEAASATFVAAKPLDRRRAFVARFRADRTMGPVEFSWTFTTK